MEEALNHKKNYARNMHLLNNNIFNNSKHFSVIQNNKLFKLKNYNNANYTNNANNTNDANNANSTSNTNNTNNAINYREQLEKDKNDYRRNDYHYSNNSVDRHKDKLNTIENYQQYRINRNDNNNYNNNNDNNNRNSNNYNTVNITEEKEKSFAEYIQTLNLKYSRPKSHLTSDIFSNDRNNNAVSSKNLRSLGSRHNIITNITSNNNNRNEEKTNKIEHIYDINILPPKIPMMTRKNPKQNDDNNYHYSNLNKVSNDEQRLRPFSSSSAGNYKKKNILCLGDNNKLQKLYNKNIKNGSMNGSDDYYEKSHINFQENLIKKLKVETKNSENYINNSLRYEKQKSAEKNNFIEKRINDNENQERTSEMINSQRKQEVK